MKEQNETSAPETAPESGGSAEAALLYRFARHLMNTNDIPITKWAVAGAALLCDLRRIDPERYDREVNGKAV